MTRIKLEHVDNLRRGKKSGAKIGSRRTPHHLYKYEEEKYSRALKNRYLEITTQDRINLKNLWEKVCIAKKWENYILIKNIKEGKATIYKDGKEEKTGNLQEMKKNIKDFISRIEKQ